MPGSTSPALYPAGAAVVALDPDLRLLLAARRRAAAPLVVASVEALPFRAAAFEPQSTADFADKPTVMYVQHSLNRLGFNAGPVDGLVGPRTRSAVSAYLSSVGEDGAGSDITPALLQRLFEGQKSAGA